MKFRVLSIPPFDRQIKRLIKKYPSLRKEIEELSESLEANPYQGVALGRNCFKIRLAISSKGRGKSGGGRVITHLHIVQTTVFMLTIYDILMLNDFANHSDQHILTNLILHTCKIKFRQYKSEQTDISDNEIRHLLGYIE